MAVDEKLTEPPSAGSTCVVTILTNNDGKKTIYHGNVGDSECIIVSETGIKRLSYKHNFLDTAEKERVKNNDGVVFGNRIFGQLAVSRALGDYDLKKWVISEPYYNRVEVKEDDRFMILGSDGLFEFLQDSNFLNFSKECKNTNILAKSLITTAIAKGSTDNISCIVVKLN